MELLNPRTSIRIHYHDSGTGSPPVILIHGFTGNYSRFAPTAEILKKRFRVIDYDLRGHGHSDKGPELDYGFGAHVEDLAGLMDALGIEKAVIVGHSMGGMVAQYFALAYPDRVLKLGLCATSASVTRGKATKRLAVSLAAFVFTHLFSVAMRAKNRRARKLSSELFPELEDPSLETTPRVAAASLRAMAAMDLRAEVRSIRIPTLVIGSITDDMIRFHLVQELANLIPGARLVTLTGASHFVPLEKPREVAGAIMELVSG